MGCWAPSKDSPSAPAMVCPLGRREFDAIASILLDAIETVAPTLLTTLCSDEPAMPQGLQEPGDLEWVSCDQPADLKHLEVRRQRQFLDALYLAAQDLLQHRN